MALQMTDKESERQGQRQREQQKKKKINVQGGVKIETQRKKGIDGP